MRQKTLNRPGEKGQALIIVVILMLISALIVAPMLSNVGSGLKTGRDVYEERTELFYAADSGVEDGLWTIKYNQLDIRLSDYEEYEYGTDYPYPASLALNEKTVDVKIQNVWVPKDVGPPDTASEAMDIINGPLIITGSIPEVSTYQIKVLYYYDVGGDPGGAGLNVQEIGIWLPPGFDYVDGSCSLEGAVGFSEDVVEHCSGKAVIWSFASVPLIDFPGDADYPMERSFTFQFSGPSDGNPSTALSWIDTSGITGIDYTWDADAKVYKITSTATEDPSDPEARQTVVEAYTARSEMRQMGESRSGNYCAVGDTLLQPTGDQNYRNRLYMQSDATINDDDIPASATVDAAFLYWSGWIDFHYKEHYQDHHGRWRWRWGEIPDLRYPDDPTPQDLQQLVEENAKVNRVTLLFGTASPLTITADDWEVLESTGTDYEGTWIYCCFYDATDLVQQLIADEKLDSNGGGTYAVKHVPEDRPGYGTYSFELYNTVEETGYPLGTPAHKLPGEHHYQTRYNYAHAGWSLIIIYSSPETKGHQLWLYDIENPNFTFREAWAPGGVPNPDFDGDGEPGGTISGFLVPDEIVDEDYAGHITCFVGEGDEGITGDYIKVNNTSLSNPQSPYNNVWNSNSPGLSVPGVDIDTFTIDSDIIEPGASSADVDLPTGSDGFTLVYIIISFRSTITSGGTISYLVHN